MRGGVQRPPPYNRAREEAAEVSEVRQPQAGARLQLLRGEDGQKKLSQGSTPRPLAIQKIDGGLGQVDEDLPLLRGQSAVVDEILHLVDQLLQLLDRFVRFPLVDLLPGLVDPLGQRAVAKGKKRGT